MHLFLFLMKLKSEICELINIHFLTDVHHRRNSSKKLWEYILYAQGLGRLNCMVRIIFLECSTFQEQLWQIIIVENVFPGFEGHHIALLLQLCFRWSEGDQYTLMLYSGWRKSETAKYFEWIIIDISIVTLMIIENRALWLARSFASSHYNHLLEIIALKASSFQKGSQFCWSESRKLINNFIFSNNHQCCLSSIVLVTTIHQYSCRLRWLILLLNIPLNQWCILLLISGADLG